MTQRVVLVLLLLWALLALGWALLDHRGEGPDGEEALLEGTDGDAIEGDPAPILSGGGVLRAGDAPEVPDWVRAIPRLHDAEMRRRFFDWVAGDPRRLLAFLASTVEPLPGQLRTVLYGRARVARFFAGASSELRPYVSTLIDALAAARTDHALAGALLGALAAAGQVDEDAWSALAGFVRDPARRTDRRLWAAELLLGDPAHDARSLPLVLALLSSEALWAPPPPNPAAGRALAQYSTAALLQLLNRIGERGAAMDPLLPALLDLQVRLGQMHLAGRWGFAEVILAALVGVAPRDPRVVERLGAALASGTQRVRTVARDALLEYGPEHLLASLEGARGPARVEGVALLQEKGLARERLAPLLLPALQDGSPSVRARAVQLLARIGRDVAEVLPIIEALFASADSARWLTGVQALGALSTVPGDKGAVLRHLSTAVRMRDERVRKLAVQSMLTYDDRPRAVVALLADLLRDTEAAVRREAVDGLGELSAHQPSARAQLQHALGDVDESVRELARWWLTEDEEEEGD